MKFPTQVILVALSFIGFGSLAYLLYYKDDEEEDTLLLKSSRSTEIKINVPKDCVGVVIGRQGSNIKEIESASGAKLNFSDRKDDSGVRICHIRGSLEAAQHAEALIHEMIANQPLIETFEMLIPGDTCGRVIGKNGDTIRGISFLSNAKITIGREAVGSNQRTVVIKGSSEQIDMARSLIAEKVAEELEYRSGMELSVSNRSPRHQPKYLIAGSDLEGTKASGPIRERLVATSSDGLLEVYVSAIESPDRLWLQVKGPCTVELDRLNDKMTEYYGKPDMRNIHALTEARVGQLVAAPFMYDQKYYRAEVSSVEGEGEDPELGLYYVDYGDSGVCPQSRAYDLRTDFLKLRFQAIECILSRVKPKDDSWSEEATALLEDLTHVALWKPLTAKINSYVERPTRAKREGSPVPCISLYDTSEEREVDMANELVNRGFALWVESKEEEVTKDIKPEETNGCEDKDEVLVLTE